MFQGSGCPVVSHPSSHPHLPSFNLELPPGEKERVPAFGSFLFSVKVGTGWAIITQKEGAEKGGARIAGGQLVTLQTLLQEPSPPWKEPSP